MGFEEYKKLFDLDDIINKVLDADVTPEFVRQCRKTEMNKVESYTAKVTDQFGMKLQEIVETQATELLDGIFDVNSIYFKKGMAAGVGLVIQLLGL